VLRSAVANAQQKEGFGGDVERLFVSKCHADNGPSMKRVRPAPMGRAFRVVKRTTHLTVEVTEKPQVIRAVGDENQATARSKASKGTKASKGKRTKKAAAKRAAKEAAA
jgi:large subunit ribosomal protein L22